MRIGQHADVADFKPCLWSRRGSNGEVLPVAQYSDFGFASRARADGDNKLLPRIDIAAITS
jgi:hypothetical protein